MRRLLIAFATLALAAGAARAQDEPLPDSVARAYLAYESALLSQDNEAATDAAGTAWRAARDERIDAELIGILAENYGRLAHAGGDYGEALAAWRDAAEISNRLQAPALDQALRWYNAGAAAFADGQIDLANRLLTRSARLQPDQPAPADLALFGETQYLIAATSIQLGRLSGVGERARAAITAFQAGDRAPDALFANAYYLSAIAHYSHGDDAESAVDFNTARGILANFDATERRQDVRVLAMWLSLTRQRLSGSELARIDAQLAASDYPPPERQGPIRIEDEHNSDAMPLRRREPRYPREAAQRGLEGIVLVQFDVSAEGIPEEIEIVRGFPSGVFDAACVQAIAQWRYSPMLIDGEPTVRRGVETSFLFHLRR